MPDTCPAMAWRSLVTAPVPGLRPAGLPDEPFAHRPLCRFSSVIVC
jgi:hypothetical protein